MPMNFFTPGQNNGMAFAQPGQNMQQMSAYGSPQNQFMSAPAQMPPQQPQSLPAPTGFVGRYISELSEVMPNEVPMDGRVALFPNRDLSEIFLKSWGQDGRILNFRYVLDTSIDLNAPKQSASPDQQEYQQLTDRLNQLEEMVKKSAAPNQRGRNKPHDGEEAKA